MHTSGVSSARGFQALRTGGGRRVCFVRGFENRTTAGCPAKKPLTSLAELFRVQ